MGKAWNLFELVRLEKSLLAGMVVLLTGVLSGDLWGFQWEFATGFLVATLGDGWAFALNDLRDLEGDAKSGRSRPLGSGQVGRFAALSTAVACLVLSLALSLLLNTLSLAQPSPCL